MKVWLIKIGEPLPINKGVRKMRMAKIADALLARGHEVVWWTSAFEHQRKQVVFPDDVELRLRPGYSIRAMKGLAYRKNVSLRRYIDQKLLARKFMRYARDEETPDVIIASMPTYELAYEAVRYARRNDIPVIIDIRDLWPDVLVRSLPRGLRWIARSLLTWDYSKVKQMLSSATTITAVSEGYLVWGLAHAQRSRSVYDGVYYLGYQKEAGSEVLSQELSTRFESYAVKKNIIFVGTMGASYELDLVVKVAERFEGEGKNDVHFIFAGYGDQYEDLMRMTANASNVSFTGWLNAEEIRALLRVASIGLVPCLHVKDSIPNKPFEYFSANLPVLSSLTGEFAEIVSKHGLGLNYRSGDVESLYEKMTRLVDDDALRKVMADNVRVFFSEQCCSDDIYERYSELIERLGEG